jgi:phosphoglycolate phosphatase-like HAD superfamily hydrolase
VTVQKLFQTGTANAEEILRIAGDPDYIYQPELAKDIRQAVYYEESEIELCYPLETIERGNFKHAVFDHDGTVSALREGWEKVMEPVMIQAILGDCYETADESLYLRVVDRVRDFIDKSTGIQTVVQMEGLVEMVQEFGLVPADKIQDKFGYKDIYNEALMQMVNRRITKLRNGELDVSDYAIKGAVIFLRELHDKGIRLYLASGTDREDVVREAEAMGYANLFNGGIYGAIGDVRKYSKKIVLNNIIKENNLHGSELVTMGDGPVELRECRKVGGTAIGIASDEIRRHGLNVEKRMRLIRAGAHAIIPDFSQPNRLMELLFG